jgi:hypothetical protein
MEKARFWQSAIRKAARSGLLMRECCQRRTLRERQFQANKSAMIIEQAPPNSVLQPRVAALRSARRLNPTVDV